MDVDQQRKYCHRHEFCRCILLEGFAVPRINKCGIIRLKFECYVYCKKQNTRARILRVGILRVEILRVRIFRMEVLKVRILRVEVLRVRVLRVKV